MDIFNVSRVGIFIEIAVNVGSAALTTCESFISLRSCERVAHMEIFCGSLDFLRTFLLCRCHCEFPLCRDEARTMVPINCKASAYSCVCMEPVGVTSSDWLDAAESCHRCVSEQSMHARSVSV